MIQIIDFIRCIKIDKKMFIRKHIFCFIPIVIYAVSSIIYPSFIHYIIDYGVSSGDIKLIILFCGLMTIVGLSMVISDYAIKTMYYKFSISLNIELKNKLFNKIINSKYELSSQKKVGDLCMSLNSDLDQIANFLTCEVPNIIKNFMTFCGVSILIVYYFKILGLFIILISLCSIVFQKKLGNRIMELSENVREAVGIESAYVTEVLSNLEDIQMSGYIALVRNKYKNNNDSVKKVAIKNNNVMYLSGTIGYMFNTLLLLIILTIGSLCAYRNTMEIGTLFSLTIYAQRVVGPIAALISSYVELKNTYPLFRRLYILIESAKEISGGKILPVHNLEKVTYKKVSFGYEGAKRIIFNEFTLDISKGDIVGIIGHNGAGKSTLLKLIFQLCVPDIGEIKINDIYNIKDVKIDYLYENIGYVGQSPVLFSGKLKDIINPLNREISDKDIFQIMKELNLDINLFGGSLDFMLSENSTNISGGEKQKLALVRLIIENKDWFILDEPTSSMDAESEKKVCTFLKKICLTKTAIIITHRTEILGICNKIIDLDI